MSPSYMVGELRGIFPALKTEHPDEDIPLVRQIITKETARTALLSGFAAYREAKLLQP